MAKKLTIEEVRQFVQENSDCELLSTEYVNSPDKLEFRCGCGEVFQTSWNAFKTKNKRQCNSCGRKSAGEKLKKNSEDFMVEFDNVSQGEYTLKGKYINSRSKIKILHNICGEEVYITPNHFLRGVGCSKCSGNKKKTHIEFCDEIKTIFGEEIIIIGKYKGTGKGILFKNRKTGIVFNATPKDVLSKKSTGRKSSVGEFEILKFLKNTKSVFKKEVSFRNCRGTNKLLFDFAVFSSESQEKPEFLIEYDGIQHFEPVDYFGGQERFEKQQLHDRIKDDYCKQNGIELIRIPYWEQDNIEEILSEKLSRLLTEDAERLELAVL